MPMFDIEREARITLERLTPRIEPLLGEDTAPFLERLTQYFPDVLRLLLELYGNHYDFYYYLEQILTTTATAYAQRPPELRALDRAREADPFWFQSERQIGAVIYVDLFAGDLQGVRDRVGYFRELGVTYLHLMPLFLSPERNNDGGYAVSDYRQVAPHLGTMAQLRALADDLRAEGISLVIDFVFNHTSDEHPWARKALQGDETCQGYYYLFPDRTMPDVYERHLREIFPEQAPGNFTYRPEIDRWVWTTFNTFQWDLNYRNPETFNAMLGELLFLANQGVEVLRLDAVAFIWKQPGTNCENLPEVHKIIRAYNALARVCAPALLFKSEAIVHPDDVASYIHRNEAPISYNPTFMACLWEALATREVKLLRHSMSHRYALPDGCAWVNYVRVHDDIGWSFADEDAGAVWINGFDHRQFLNRFYTGQFPGSFATGLPFNFNPVNHDMRICGTTASLCGLERALTLGDKGMIDDAIGRIVMLYSLILSAGGIPLIYIGDEIATLNDYSYQDDPIKAQDSRWVHRPAFDWARAERRTDPETVEGRVYNALRDLIAIRKATPALANGQTLFFDTLNPHVLGFVRNHDLLVLANFSERPQALAWATLGAYWSGGDAPVDLITGKRYTTDQPLVLSAYQAVWLTRAT